MTTECYDLYGLRVCSELPLAGAPRSDGDDGCDLRVVVGPTARPETDAPSGRVVAELTDDGDRLYTATEHADGFTFRVHGLGDFDLSRDLETVICRPTPELSHELAAVLVTGAIVSFVLSCRGAHVLHGSAVSTQLGTIAFVAGSGMGKSTIAAQFCARGAELITDDVLVLDLAHHVEVVPGPIELRLRAKATPVIDAFGARPDTRVTADERLAVRPAASLGRRSPLVAILCPRPSPAGDELRLEMLTPSQALWELTAWPRIESRDMQQVARQFEGNAVLVERVPVYKAHIPWGPPFDDTVPDAIMDQLAIAP